MKQQWLDAIQETIDTYKAMITNPDMNKPYCKLCASTDLENGRCNTCIYSGFDCLYQKTYPSTYRVRMPLRIGFLKYFIAYLTTQPEEAFIAPMQFDIQGLEAEYLESIKEKT